MKITTLPIRETASVLKLGRYTTALERLGMAFDYRNDPEGPALEVQGTQVQVQAAIHAAHAQGLLR